MLKKPRYAELVNDQFSYYKLKKEKKILTEFSKQLKTLD